MENRIDFSRRSRRAILLFTVILLVIVLIPRVYYLFHPPERITFSQTTFQRKQFREYRFQNHKRHVYAKKGPRFKIPPSKFDPNTYSAAQWMSLGLSEKQAAVVLKFGRGGFYSASDVQRVFVIPDQLFALIRDSLFYPARPEPDYERPAKTMPARIELNTATEEELIKLRGIGSFFAKNIVKKRSELGGFFRVEQLLEIWKFDQEKLDAVLPYISLDPSLVKQININEATAEAL